MSVRMRNGFLILLLLFLSTAVIWVTAGWLKASYLRQYSTHAAENSDLPPSLTSLPTRATPTFEEWVNQVCPCPLPNREALVHMGQESARIRAILSGKLDGKLPESLEAALRTAPGTQVSVECYCEWRGNR